MDDSIERQISDCEEALRLAMLSSDVAALDRLLAPDLLFTNHVGQMMSKQDDLEAHRTGTLKISAISTSDHIIKPLHDAVVLVSAQTHIDGSFAGNSSQANFRFTRVWTRAPGSAWQVVAGHSCVMP